MRFYMSASWLSDSHLNENFDIGSSILSITKEDIADILLL